MTSSITEERLHEILIENERKLIEDLWIPELITEYKVVKQERALEEHCKDSRTLEKINYNFPIVVIYFKTLLEYDKLRKLPSYRKRYYFILSIIGGKE